MSTVPATARGRRRPRLPRLLSETSRQWTAAVVAYVVWFAVASDDDVSPFVGTLLVWVLYCGLYLALTAFMFTRRTPDEVRARIAEHRLPRQRWRRWLSGRSTVRTFLLVASPVALAAAGFALPRRAELLPSAPWAVATLAVLAVVLSWCLVHTVFAQRYALLYYEAPEGRRPLEFPGREQPDYWDFTYFAYAVGSTFGTTDVAVLTSRVRRTVLGHGVFSFAFNTVVLGLTISFLITT